MTGRMNSFCAVPPGKVTVKLVSNEAIRMKNVDRERCFSIKKLVGYRGLLLLYNKQELQHNSGIEMLAK